MQDFTLPPHANDGTELDPGTAAFYRHVLQTLKQSGPPFLIGGAYAFNYYSRINRHTRDLDIFLRRADFEPAAQALRAVGYEVELTYPHWLGKIHSHGIVIDLIFSSGNGISDVDDAWFAHASPAELFGIETAMCPAEETIWSKAYIMERERFDGADIVHMLRACADQLDWPRLLQRFDDHWRVLLSHLTLFGFVYPAHRDLIPEWVMDDLIERLRHETHTRPMPDSVCQGTLLSREQYLNDIAQQGLQDGRLSPRGKMSAQDAVQWTNAISRHD